MGWSQGNRDWSTVPLGTKDRAAAFRWALESSSWFSPLFSVFYVLKGILRRLNTENSEKRGEKRRTLEPIGRLMRL